jgi:hypothetical protein
MRSPGAEKRNKERPAKMNPMALNLVIKFFPEHKNTLETLYRQNQSFRSLCQDFRDCVHALEYWCGSLPVKEKASALCEEYKALCADLKDEIMKWLEEQNNEA